jgi:CBS-domain-containing membrane protein
MKHGYRTLVHEKLTLGTGISRPVRPVSIVTLDDPAIEVMTDLEKEKAVTIGPTASIDTANRLMMASGVRLLLVVESLDRVVGLITATDILGEKPMQVVGRTPGRAYSDIVVQNIMSPAEEIEVLAFDEVRTARVGDVVATLRDAGRQHALVVAQFGPAATPVIRGIFSATQIGKQLGIRVDTTQPAKTFAELEAALTASSHKLSHPRPHV